MKRPIPKLEAKDLMIHRLVGLQLVGASEFDLSPRDRHKLGCGSNSYSAMGGGGEGAGIGEGYRYGFGIGYGMLIGDGNGQGHLSMEEE